ncbi:STAS domain-containing protein [Pyxidicoccus xibeiensis]|uniref:STAS domain-containing protein n=1 Tax=Pyxidicoccus xibeiensis TaxID=2906759 RepID=UPI0020A6FA29|nr:STAS domain-containing protein [Pyxidicoccus xibeiensis]MCP3143500.1 STAS domain-containing protein [Pyxidicoccus xibeiensis]
MAANPKINIGFDVEWDLERGLNLWAGTPTLSMWVPTTVAGMMEGLCAMVGVERFNLCMQLGGQQSVEGDWAVISSRPSFEEGLKLMASIAWPAGWGRWELVSLDRERKQAHYRVTNGWEALYQRALNVKWGSAMMAGKLAGITSKLFDTPCWAEQTSFAATGAAHDEFLVSPTDVTIEERLNLLLAAGQATNADLAVALQKLRTEIDERARSEEQLREKLLLIQEQERALRELSAPILQVWNGVLAVPVMGGLNQESATSLMDRLLHALPGTQTRHVILDLTAVDMVDTNIADHLLRIVRAVELLGARVVVTGIRAAVSQTLVSLGVGLGNITTLRNLQEGLSACLADQGMRLER